MKPQPIRGPIDQDQLDRMRQASEQRAKELRERMGSRHLLHPDNRVQRVPYQPILTK